MAHDYELKKRYWVLVYETYYHCGGFGDVRFTTEDKEEALAYNRSGDYLEVWDMDERKEIHGPNSR